MKKIALLASLALSSAVFADPSAIPLDFTCPSASGAGVYSLTNFGDRVGGYGTELVAGAPAINKPYFTYLIPSGAKIPAKLASGAYTNAGTDYDNSTNKVTCSYTSAAKYDPFSVSYQLTNGNGGMITKKTASCISILQFVGLAKN